MKVNMMTEPILLSLKNECLEANIKEFSPRIKSVLSECSTGLTSAPCDMSSQRMFTRCIIARRATLTREYHKDKQGSQRQCNVIHECIGRHHDAIVAQTKGKLVARRRAKKKGTVSQVNSEANATRATPTTEHIL